MTTEKDRERMRYYYQTHKDEIAQTHLKYYAEHKKEILDYHKKYFENHKQELSVKNKQWKIDHAELSKQNDRTYHVKNVINEAYRKYCGVVSCPKCGRKGHKWLQASGNRKTKKIWKERTMVRHFKRVFGRNTYDGVCYIGMGDIHL